jgi:hypothetical protein
MTENQPTEEREQLQKHTLNLRAGDYAKLEALFPRTKAAKVIRNIISQVVDRAEREVPAAKVDVDTDEVLK